MKPEEMEKAIVRNLSEKRELVEYLKKIHSVGHFQAQTIVKYYLMKTGDRDN